MPMTRRWKGPRCGSGRGQCGGADSCWRRSKQAITGGIHTPLPKGRHLPSAKHERLQQQTPGSLPIKPSNQSALPTSKRRVRGATRKRQAADDRQTDPRAPVVRV